MRSRRAPWPLDHPGRGAKAHSRRARELTARLLAPVVTRAQLTRRAYALVSAHIRGIVCPSSAEVRYEALEFLLQHGVPIKLLRLAFYVDEVAGGRRFLNVEWESEPEVALTGVVIAPSVVGPAPAAVDTQGRDFRDVTLAEVAEHVVTPAGLVWHRPRRGETHRATLLAGGRIRLERGDEFSSPSAAAMAAADVVSYDGWYAWRMATDTRALNDLRREIAGTDAPAEADLFTEAPPTPIVQHPA